ncbi:MAG: hypothetical protein ACREJQ_00100 [bacterium]
MMRKNLLILVAFLMGCVGVIVAVSAGEDANLRQLDTHRSGRVKENLVLIATSLQRYRATFNEFPEYIWGGSTLSWQKAVVNASATDVYDPLIREGIWSRYPRNPYMSDGHALCAQTNNDPRFGCLPGDETDAGYGGVLMGNILSDYRNARTQMPKGSQQNRYYLFANEHNSTELNWIPGDFGYRRIDLEHFVLFAYGSPRRPGLDFLTTEFEIEERKPGFKGPPDALLRLNIEKNGTVQSLVGNPDGVPDGVILVITEDGTFQQTP